MVAEGEVGKHGTSEFGRWNTEPENKLTMRANDCVEAE